MATTTKHHHHHWLLDQTSHGKCRDCSAVYPYVSPIEHGFNNKNGHRIDARVVARQLAEMHSENAVAVHFAEMATGPMRHE